MHKQYKINEINKQIAVLKERYKTGPYDKKGCDINNTVSQCIPFESRL